MTCMHFAVSLCHMHQQQTAIVTNGYSRTASSSHDVIAFFDDCNEKINGHLDGAPYFLLSFNSIVVVVAHYTRSLCILVNY